MFWALLFLFKRNIEIQHYFLKILLIFWLDELSLNKLQNLEGNVMLKFLWQDIGVTHCSFGLQGHYLASAAQLNDPLFHWPSECHLLAFCLCSLSLFTF